MSGRLRLRRGVVVGVDPLTVEVEGEGRPAWADTALLGEMREGDEVVVNVAALDLGLGSGGFDVVHVNLTRGLDAEAGEEHVMKLNYSSIQHPVEPVEAPIDTARFLGDGMRRKGTTGRGAGGTEREDGTIAVLVLPLHGHLPAAAWAAGQGGPGPRGSPLRVGYVQSAGGALPGALSDDVATLREGGLICGHVTAGPCYGGEHEAISVAGALDAASSLGWEAAIVAPGPGIIGSETRLGHGGIAALDSAHAALALGMRTLLAPRLSGADPRERHRPVSHHTLTVMGMLLGAVEVPVPAGEAVPIAVLAEACGWRHRLREATPDLEGFAASDLPARVMGRGIEEDPLFFAAALAAGAALRGKG